MDWVFVTGLMRSGTSMVAEMVHRLGVPVALTLLAPPTADGRLEWEDAEASLTLARLIPLGGGTAPTPAAAAAFDRWWPDYRRRREAAARSIRWPGRTPPRAIAVKSPLLLFFADRLKGTIIATRRDPAAVAASVRRSFTRPDLAEATNALLRERLEGGALAPALTIDYEHDAAAIAGALAGALGVTDPERIRRAAAVKE